MGEGTGGEVARGTGRAVLGGGAAAGLLAAAPLNSATGFFNCIFEQKLSSDCFPKLAMSAVQSDH